MGAWIETGQMSLDSGTTFMSHPAWVRGLKLFNIIGTLCVVVVAPCVGAWIETVPNNEIIVATNSRTLRGCVD